MDRTTPRAPTRGVTDEAAPAGGWIPGTLAGWLVGLGLAASAPGAAGCKARGERGPEPVEPSEGDAWARRVAELADRVDPGPQPSPLEWIPEPTRGQLVAWAAAETVEPAELDQGLSEVEQLMTGPNELDDERLVAIVWALAKVLLALETREVPPERGLEQRQRAFASLDNPIFTGKGFIARTVQRVSGQLDPAQLAALEATMTAASTAVRRHHRHHAAAWLRDRPNDRRTGQVLRGLVKSVTREDPELAIELQRAVIDAEAGGPRPWLQLADLCATSLELRCAEEAYAVVAALEPQVRAAGGLTDESLPRVATRIERARALAAARAGGVAGADVDALLTQASWAGELERWEHAQTLLEAAIARDPADGRPYCAMARVALARDVDYALARRWAEQSRGRSGLTGDDLETRIGIVGPALLFTELPRLIAGDDSVRVGLQQVARDLRADADEYAAFNPARAGILQILFSTLDEALARWGDGPALEAFLVAELRRAHHRALALLERFGGDPEVWAAALASARITGDIADLERIVARDPSELPTDPSVRLARAAYLRDYVSSQRAWNHLDALDAAIAAVPADGLSAAQQGQLARLRVDRALLGALALEPDQHPPGKAPKVSELERVRAWMRAAELAVGLINEGPAPGPSLATNAGVALLEVGEPALAEELFRYVEQATPDKAALAKLNQARAGLAADPIAALRELAARGSSPTGVDALALWSLAAQLGPRLGRGLATQADRAAKAPRQLDLTMVRLDRSTRALNTGEVNVALDYSQRSGLRVRVEVATELWLVARP